MRRKTAQDKRPTLALVRPAGWGNAPRGSNREQNRVDDAEPSTEVAKQIVSELSCACLRVLATVSGITRRLQEAGGCVAPLMCHVTLTPPPFGSAFYFNPKPGCFPPSLPPARLSPANPLPQIALQPQAGRERASERASARGRRSAVLHHCRETRVGTHVGRFPQ